MTQATFYTQEPEFKQRHVSNCGGKSSYKYHISVSGEVRSMRAEQLVHLLLGPTSHLCNCSTRGASAPVVPSPLPHRVFLAQRSAVLLYSPGSRSSHSHLRLIGSFWSTKNSDLRPRGAANLAGAAEPRNCRGRGKLFITPRAFHFALGISGPEAEA